jgi:small neutral amino acid transporter SnatA (MarC family)
VTPLGRVARAALVLAGALVLAFGVVAPPERCPSVDAPQLRTAAQAAVDWFARNQNEDGSWLYQYDSKTNKAPPEYNVVRHAGAVMALYQAADHGLPRALASADRGTAWSLDMLIERDGWSALALNDEVATGATALFVTGLAIRREATGDRRYDRLIARLGRFLVSQTEPSGAVLAQYDRVRDAPVPHQHSVYYTGEAYWALARLHLDFPHAGWGKVADRIGAYLATKRDKVEHHWPPLEDHWAAYGLSDTVRFPERGPEPLTEDELHYARRQAELFGVDLRWVSQRMGPWGALVRGPHTPRGGGYGVLGEGLTGLWRTARAEPRMADLREPIADRAQCLAGLAIDAQSTAKDAAGTASPGRVEGAWFRDDETRMDDQQHALAALLRTVAIVQAAPAPGGPDKQTPPIWLWALVLLLALNPARGVFGLPRRGAGAVRWPLEPALLGGALGALVVIAASAIADPLLDALGVSDPAFRIAAGVVALIAGVADVFRRPPSPEPALSGRRAALVPVAVPIVARPALILLAVGAGADRGLTPSVLAMAVGVSALGVLAATTPPDGPRGRALRWAARVIALGLVAGGVTLALDGILDV